MLYNSSLTKLLFDHFPLQVLNALFGHKFRNFAGLPLLMGSFLVIRWIYHRYFGSMRSATIARTKNFWISKIGAAPPPSEADSSDELSAFLLQCGQDPTQQPWSVCWSIFGTPLVILNSLQSIKDILINAQMKKTNNGREAAERGQLICKIQNVVFGGKNINNTIGQVVCHVCN
jgi:hypothetical protein